MNEQELKNKWQHIISKARNLPLFSWTGDAEAAYLCELASRAQVAAEIGVYMGFTSYVMLAANPHLHLWSCDPFAVAGTYEVSCHYLRDFIAQGRCEIIRKETTAASLQLQHMRGKLDFVMSDDGHLQHEVENDINCFWPLVRSGGVMCGHDLEHPDNGVTLAVKAKFGPTGFTEPVPRMWEVVKQ